MPRLGDIGQQKFDANGDPLGGGKITFYETGTTTLATTYSDLEETTPNANPVILTADGRQPDIFFTGYLKAVLSDSNDVIIETRDPVGIVTSGGGGAGDPWWTFVAQNEAESFTAVAGNFYLIPAGGTVAVTLPASPSQGDRVGLRRLGTGTTQVNRNGSNLEGGTDAASSVTVGGGGVQKHVDLVYLTVGATTGWWVFGGSIEIAA